MKIGKDLVVDSIINLTKSTSNKFWGLLSLFVSIRNQNSTILPDTTYAYDEKKLATVLDRLFYFGSDPRTYREGTKYFRLSKIWYQQLVDIAIKNKKKPDILDASIFYFKDNDYTSRKLLSTNLVEDFIREINIEQNIIKEIFKSKKNAGETIFLEEDYPKREILEEFKRRNSIDLTHNTLSFDGSFILQKRASDLKSAPFYQTLYSGTNVQKILLLTDFIPEEYYGLEISKKEYSESKNEKITGSNKIFYGSPGTGKSFTVSNITNKVSPDQVERVIFHPEYDYYSFVGGYKPSADNEGNIKYEFVPQAFTKIYVNAWKNLNKKYYLQIEEINRGNCAAIFGDLIQLLDRDSNYSISVSRELKEYLEYHLVNEGDEHSKQGISYGKIKLPPNLELIATMNTSDQSLFPMDSAFKRRWDWIYVPIDYNSTESDFTIQIDNVGQYRWLAFLKSVNEKIFKITESQDKQIGNFFVKPNNNSKIIDQTVFINKVIFYLWNDVFKDEDETIFVYTDETEESRKITYEDFFSQNSSKLIKNIFEENLGIENINKSVESNEDFS